MILKTTLRGQVYQFGSVKEVLAKAKTTVRSGDVLAGTRPSPTRNALPANTSSQT